MDFIDNQAEESEGDSSDHSLAEDEPKNKKRKMQKDKKKTKRAVQSSDDEDDEDDDEEGAEEMKGFIADEDDEPEEDADDDNSVKSDKLEEDEDLDDDDMDLIQENLDIKTKKTRVLQMSDSEDEDDRTAIKKKLFGEQDDEGDGPSSSGRDREREYATRENYSDSEQSEDNFIVNEDGDRPTHRHHRKKDLNMPEGALDEARDIFGVEDFNLDDFYDEDEEPVDDEEDDMMEDEDGVERVRRVRPKEKKSTLLDTMEPSELERGFLAPADKKIQLEDRPERFQLRRTPVTEADEDELELEAKWIYHYAFGHSTVSIQDRKPLRYVLDADEQDKAEREVIICEKICETLKNIRNQVYEVPFIAFYRKEGMSDKLAIDDLWKIYEWDEKWCHLRARKRKLLELMERMQHYQLDGDVTPRRPLTEHDLNDVHGVESPEGLADVSAQFQMYYGSDLAKLQEWEKSRHADDDEAATANTRFKQSSRTDKYQLCVECGIGDMAGRFGLTARQFAENLDWKKHEIEQDEVHSMVAAEEYVSTSFPTPEAVIAGAVFMMAKEISRQPQVRERIRRMYRMRLTFSAKPTKQGREQIDDTHPLWNKRYIKEKEVTRLENEEYLWYQQAKTAGTMEVKLICDREEELGNSNALVDTILLEGPFKKDEYSDLVEDWNALREQAVRMAVNDMLLPYLEQEVHQKLIDEAKNYVMTECTASMAKRINVAAYRPSEEELEEDDEEYSRLGEVRVMAISYPNDFNEASFGAIVDQDGQVIDYVRIIHFLKRGFGEGPMQRLKAESMSMFKRMVDRKRPHIIGLSAEDLEALRLKRDVEDALMEMVRDGVIPKSPQVVLLDNEAAKVYMNSKQAALELPDYPPTLRQAVSLARHLMDPLVEYSHLWNPDEDIYCLTMHPLQREVNKDDLGIALAREMINKVNQLGVDINKCLEHTHTANMLQFVAGLGPRKAAHLLKTIKQNENLLESRTKLVTLCNMGPKVFMNCAGFIKIDTTKVAEKTEAYVEVLDGSRVHPETYEWARKMAVDALEVDDNADPTAALEEILQAPERLKDLDLDAFAEELQRQNFGDKKDTLYDISAELNYRYRDLRPPFMPIPDHDIFLMLTRDAKDTFVEGKRMRCTALSVQYRKLTDEDRQKSCGGQPEFGISGSFACNYCYKQFTDVGLLWNHLSNMDIRNGGCPGSPVGIRMKLENGVIGFVPNKLLSDRPETFKHPLEKVKLGEPYYCRIVKVDPEKFSCLLSCKTSDLNREDDVSRDVCWDYDAETHDKEADRVAKEARKTVQTLTKRVIAHPCFYNVNYREAERLLNKLDQGDAVIRPSSKSTDRLTVTWKVADGVFQNIDVQELDKEHAFELGKRLIVDHEEYEDLDEIITRFIQPMASYARDICNNKHYMDGVKAEEVETINNRLEEEKAKTAWTVFVLTPSIKLPGKFVISWRTNVTPIHEYMTVTPKGIRFRARMFPKFSQLLNWFKEHYKDPSTLPQSHAYQRR